MKPSISRWVTSISLSLAVLSSFSHPAELDDRLAFLEPLIGTEWAGGYVGTDAPDIRICLRFEPVLDGKAVRYLRVAEAVNFSMETYIFWNPSSQEVRFFNLDNRGGVGEGIVELRENRITLHRQDRHSSRNTESKTTFEIDREGTLKDTFVRMQGGDWVLGHHQEFKPREETPR